MAQHRTHGITFSKPFLIFLLIALLLGLLYISAIIRQLNSPAGLKSRLLASPVDFEHETGAFDPFAKIGEFNGHKVPIPPESKEPPRKVLGDTTAEKRIEVDLSQQRLYAFEGDRKVFDFLISSGKWGRTPTGEFTIWTKFRYTKMSGGSKELHTYYYLPNVPYVMFFSNAEVAASRGFSLHGTYWHDNFGHPMSHGCINMKTSEVEQLYYWAGPVLPDGVQSGPATKDNPGTKIIIYGEPPSE